MILNRFIFNYLLTKPNNYCQLETKNIIDFTYKTIIEFVETYVLKY